MTVYKIPVTLECEALYNIEAENIQEALQQIREKLDTLSVYASELLKPIGDDVLVQGSLDIVNMSIDTSRLYIDNTVEGAPREVKWLNKLTSEGENVKVDNNKASQESNLADATYLEIVENVLQYGSREHNRTGVGTIAMFAEFYKLDLNNGLPILTTKQVNFNAIVHELLWYISGEPHIRNLRKHTSIWNEWSDQEGNLETAYGRYWTHYPLVHPYPGGTTTAVNNNELFWEGHPNRYLTPDYKEALVGQGNPYVKYETRLGWGFNQLAYIEGELKLLKEDPTRSSKRRLVLTAWHPGNATVSKLPPCHLMAIFSVIGNKLNCHLTQRSGDLGLGIAFNMTSYSLLTMMLANSTGYEYGQFAHTIVDAHVYENHITGLQEQLKRSSYPLPQINITLGKSIFALRFEDFKLLNYQHHPAIKLAVAV